MIGKPRVTTEDCLFSGALHLRQPARGHRAGTDAVLLAAACPGDARRVVDLGCGVGTVGLRVAQAVPASQIALVDVDPAILALASGNIALNGLGDRVRCVSGDCTTVTFPASDTGLAGWADMVVTNPPFFDSGRGQVSPVALKARAHGFEADQQNALDAWIKGALRCLAPRGEIVLIHRADALSVLLAALDRRFGNIRLRFVQARADAPAIRVLVRATLASRAPLQVLPPLVLNDAEGTFTPHSAAIHAGTATLDWA